MSAEQPVDGPKKPEEPKAAEDQFGSEVHVPAAPGFLKEIRVDQRTGANTIGHAFCAGCGDHLPLENSAVCAHGCVACKGNCIHVHEDRPLCAAHFATDVIDKRAWKVLLCLCVKVRSSKIKDFTMMSKEQVYEALAKLQQSRYLVVKNHIICKEYAPTDSGTSALKTGVKVFAQSGDYIQLKSRLEEAGLWPKILK